MEDQVEPVRNVHVAGQVALDDPEGGPVDEMFDVAGPTGEEAVHADHLRTLVQQPFAG